MATKISESRKSKAQIHRNREDGLNIEEQNHSGKEIRTETQSDPYRERVKNSSSKTSQRNNWLHIYLLILVTPGLWSNYSSALNYFIFLFLQLPNQFKGFTDYFKHIMDQLDQLQW
ncbi:MAG: hypothetical protein IPP46_16255 [Bacteroidetes bacterium]|nr:hypothetical protein [Bacteroidota bacterium]